MNNEIYARRIDHPAAWHSSEIGGKEGLTHRMGHEHLEALHELAVRTRHKRPEEIRREEFDHPVIANLMAAVRHQLMHGYGAVVLSGLDMRRLTLDEYARLYWGLGMYLGEAAPQSYRGDKIGYVQKEDNNPTGRGYLMDIELGSHSDFHEILSLACVSRAQQGGLSGMVSSLAIHNLILASRPELLAPLYQGFFHVGAPDQPLSAEKVPVFCNVGGTVSCFYHGMLWRLASHRMGVALPSELTEALQYFDGQARHPDVRADFMLEPGEMLFWHNFVCLHSRTAFKDSVLRKRLLLRLWLNVPDGRPMLPQFRAQAHIMDVAHAIGRTGLDYGDYFASR